MCVYVIHLFTRKSGMEKCMYIHNKPRTLLGNKLLYIFIQKRGRGHRKVTSISNFKVTFWSFFLVIITHATMTNDWSYKMRRRTKRSFLMFPFAANEMDQKKWWQSISFAFDESTDDKLFPFPLLWTRKNLVVCWKRELLEERFFRAFNSNFS